MPRQGRPLSDGTNALELMAERVAHVTHSGKEAIDIA
jgi:hypothetical protein